MADNEGERQGDAAPAEYSKNLEAEESRIDAFLFALVRGWGMMFRTVFIPAIGIVCYFWVDPQPLGDVPFSELTLNAIFGNLFAWTIAVGCVVWFFNFPDQTKAKSSRDNPYVFWGQFGGMVVLVIVAAYYLLVSG